MTEKEHVQGWLIDENGFIVDSVIAESEDSNVITKAFPTDIVLIKPKWNGTEWIEGATQEEIDELTKVEPSPPTDTERIEMLEETIMFLLMGGI